MDYNRLSMGHILILVIDSGGGGEKRGGEGGGEDRGGRPYIHGKLFIFKRVR